MKIVCEACQAKYSIADDKVRGKVFKIRCKKCSHVIVVRGTGEAAGGASGEFASSPSSAPDLALDAGWHIVVDGEQVGPLSEGDIKSRLVRGEITPETYIWKEGLADWVKIATLSEFASEGDAGSPFAGAEPGGLFANAPTSVSAPPVATTSNGGGMFAAASAPAAGGGLFSSPTRPVSDDAATEVRGGAASLPSYGGGGGYDAPMAGMTGGQAAGGLTGQRHENSVLFSLSNLEALAKPTSAPLPAARASSPSTSTTTEGSGLIDIRAMANMTLGGQAAKAAEARASDLPAFSAPQFSPVAPVLLAPSSSPPKWFLGVVGFLVVVVIILVVISVRILSRPEQAAVTPPPVAPTAPVPGTATNPPPSTAVAAKPAGSAATPPTTQPPAANEALPPREGPAGAATKEADRPDRPVAAKASRPAGASKRPTPRGASDDPVSSRLSGAFAPAPPKPAAEAPRKAKLDDIDSLLEAAAGGKKSAAPRREAEEEPAPSGEKLPPLGREGIVKGMNGVLPKARECYAQFKVPGVANAKITVNPSGKVTTVTVSGKFAGTPSGNCVESAIKTGRFDRSSGLTFDYPVPLR